MFTGVVERLTLSLLSLIHTHTQSGGARYADMDERPYCKKCFEKVPVELRRRLKKQDHHF